MIVRELDGVDGALDATSPYSYPGAEVSGEPIDPADVDWSGAGLVSLFLRDRLGDPPALLGAADRSVVLVSDPEQKRKSRMSDRQQIRKNEAAGYEITRIPGPETSAEQRASFHAVYTETMDHRRRDRALPLRARLLRPALPLAASRIFIVTGPEGDVAAAAITVISDGFLHYYLSGTADSHRKRAPSKNLIVAVTDYADEPRPADEPRRRRRARRWARGVQARLRQPRAALPHPRVDLRPRRSTRSSPPAAADAASSRATAPDAGGARSMRR